MSIIPSRDAINVILQWKELYAQHMALHESHEELTLEMLKMLDQVEIVRLKWKNAVTDSRHLEYENGNLKRENKVLRDKLQNVQQKQNRAQTQITDLMSVIENLSNELSQYKWRFDEVKTILSSTNDISAEIVCSYDNAVQPSLSQKLSFQESFHSSHNSIVVPIKNRSIPDQCLEGKEFDSGKIYEQICDSFDFLAGENSKGSNSEASIKKIANIFAANSPLKIRRKSDTPSCKSNTLSNNSNAPSSSYKTAMTGETNGPKCEFRNADLSFLSSDGTHETTMQWSEPISCEESELRNQLSNLSIEDLCGELKKMDCEIGPMDAENRKLYERKLARLTISSKDGKPLDLSIKKFSASLQTLILDDQLGKGDSKKRGEAQEQQLQLRFLKFSTKSTAAFFCYLLIDPSMISDSKACNFGEFVLAIFYVGKGKNSRPLQHLVDANTARQMQSANKNHPLSKKLERILDLWDRGMGVISLPFLHNVHSNESLIREGIKNLTNERRTNLKKLRCNWSKKQIEEFGAMLLKKAHVIFKNERCRPILKDEIDK
ncbi:LEM domain-containing protein [Ditylenchus destructor]|uniref:LEM domain-containing protein n=1 Tax=Ditylenchus destructor TaxID=166010 RepID=A0AAD4N0Y7_9BILA|nr:LEM domain-containing protein [Ditylenchus destructor]